MSEIPRPESNAPKEDFKKLFPTPEDWNALQGGKPRVFWDPIHPTRKWIVLHVYDEHPDAEKRFKSGAIVDTLSPTDQPMKLLHLGITRKDEYGDERVRDIVVPSFMARRFHGDECEVRSASMGGDGYTHIANQPIYENFLNNLRSKGYSELRFGMDADGSFKMKPLPGIRPAAPLEESAA